MTDSATVADLRARAARVFGQARVERTCLSGVDLVEARRHDAVIEGADGREYLDCVSGRGIFNLGRAPQGPLAGLRAAVETADQGNFPLISAEKAGFAERLAAFAPGDFQGAVFSVSRGESLDAACKLARGHSGRTGLLTVGGGWYGETGFALTLSERPDKADFEPLIPDVRSVPLNDLAAAEAAISRRDAAFVLEPVQAENGCRVVDPEWLQAVARICADRGVLLIFDETQSGMGRTGARFAYGHWGVVPDILVIGESVAAGAFPICATLFPERLSGFFSDHPLIHLSTFGGSDVGCLVGQRTLDEYESLRPWENAATMGSRLREGLDAVAAAQSSLVAGVDGLGLLLALDLGDPQKASACCAALAAAGVLAVPGRVAAGTVVLRPSLLITELEVDRLVEALGRALAEAGKPPTTRRRRPAARPAAGATSSAGKSRPSGGTSGKKGTGAARPRRRRSGEQ